MDNVVNQLLTEMQGIGKRYVLCAVLALVLTCCRLGLVSSDHVPSMLCHGSLPFPSLPFPSLSFPFLFLFLSFPSLSFRFLACALVLWFPVAPPISNNVFVVGATNKPGSIDAAITRPGRLDQPIEIGLPDYPARVSIFRACLRRTPVARNIDFLKMARLTDGYTGSDIKNVCNMACQNSVTRRIREDPEAKAEGWDISAEDFATAFRCVGGLCLLMCVSYWCVGCKRRHVSHAMCHCPCRGLTWVVVVWLCLRVCVCVCVCMRVPVSTGTRGRL